MTRFSRIFELPVDKDVSIEEMYSLEWGGWRCMEVA